jgi:malate/lactate dehydrogenase
MPGARSPESEDVALLRMGSASHAPAAATFAMVESIPLDHKRVLPRAVLLQRKSGPSGSSSRSRS